MLTKRSAKGQTLFRKEVQQRKLPQQENEELKASHTSSSSFYQDRLEMIRVSHQEIQYEVEVIAARRVPDDLLESSDSWLLLLLLHLRLPGFSHQQHSKISPSQPASWWSKLWSHLFNYSGYFDIHLAVNHPTLFHMISLIMWWFGWEILKLWTWRHHLHSAHQNNTSCNLQISTGIRQIKTFCVSTEQVKPPNVPWQPMKSAKN